MPLPEPGESIESQSFQRMTRGSITACTYPRWSFPPVVCLQRQHCSKRRVGDESSVAVTVLTKERSRNLIHQKQRIWTIFRRTKNDSLWRLRLSSVRGPGSDRQGDLRPVVLHGNGLYCLVQSNSQVFARATRGPFRAPRLIQDRQQS